MKVKNIKQKEKDLLKPEEFILEMQKRIIKYPYKNIKKVVRPKQTP